jgi:hypothetical protein
VGLDGFQAVFGSGRGRDEEVERAAAASLAAHEERVREEGFRRAREHDRRLIAEREAMVERIRAAALEVLDEREEWNAPEFREAVRLRLKDYKDHAWVNVVILNMSGDGGVIKPTVNLRIRRAPARHAS